MKTNGTYLASSRKERDVDVSAVVVRNPEALLEHWCSPIELRTGEALPPPPEESKREAEAFLAWLQARRSYSVNTLHHYLAEFRKLCAASAQMGKSTRELSYEDCLRLRGLVEPKVLKLYVKFLAEVTGEERYEKLYARVKVPSEKRSLPEALTREQVEKLLEECGREDPELKVLAALIYETGARAGEILRLKARDVEFDEHGARLWIRRSKSEPRVLRVALYASLLTAWIEARKPAPEEGIFRKDYTTYLRRLARAWRRAGLPPTRRKFHILRHTRATELLKARVFTEKEMMLWFGWRTRGMIDVYARVTMEDAEASYLAAVKDVEVKKEEPPKPKTCPRCKALNPPEAKYCLRCATPLELPVAADEYKQSIALAELLSRLEKLEKLLAKTEREV